MPITTEKLKPFLRRVLIETGTYDGDGITSALNAGFEEIWSVEFHPDRFKACTEKFKNDSRVHILHGDSRDQLDYMLGQVKEPATLWLDAHGVETLDPIIGELQVIAASGAKDHILLLDDMWETDVVNQERLGLRKSIHKINQDYKIYFIDGQSENCPPIPNSIMVADPRKD